ncbi:hypothetical protein V1279_006203 [Bradyrhizobium sp. AZCC 1610]|uniref:DUF2513 domain-containing protein n=1 Tax=Bradyrhizobium sp. AZCC 1610 TaxID=3117020 RepID=UPI002FF3BAB9
MQRDMGLVRELLLKIAVADKPPKLSTLVSGRGTDDSGYGLAAYHMQMLIEEVGFVRGINANSSSGKEWINLELTWHGQDFLESIRDPTVWENTQAGVKKLGGVSFDIFVGLAKQYLKAEAKKRLNLDL